MRSQLKSPTSFSQLDASRSSTPMSLQGLNSKPITQNSSNQRSSYNLGGQEIKGNEDFNESLQSLNFNPSKGGKGLNSQSLGQLSINTLSNNLFFSQRKPSQSEQKDRYQIEGKQFSSIHFQQTPSRKYKFRTSVNFSQKPNEYKYPLRTESFSSSQKKGGFAFSSDLLSPPQLSRKSFNSIGNLCAQSTPNGSRVGTAMTASMSNLKDTPLLEDEREIQMNGVGRTPSFSIKAKDINLSKSTYRFDQIPNYVTEAEEDKMCLEQLRLMSPIPHTRKQIDSKQNAQFMPYFSSYQGSSNKHSNNNDDTLGNVENSYFSSGQLSFTSFLGKKKTNNSISNSNIFFDQIPTQQELEDYTNIKSFNDDYKKISQIVEEVNLFNDPMRVQEAMLTNTIQKNVLPRKLGIITGINSKRSLSEAIKKRKKLVSSQSINSVAFQFSALQTSDQQSFTTNLKAQNSSHNRNESQESTISKDINSLSEVGGLSKENSIFEQDSMESKPVFSSASLKKTNHLKGLSINSDIQIKQSQAPMSSTLSSTSSNFFPSSIMKRSNTSQSSILSKQTPRTPINLGPYPNNGEFERKKQLDRVAFKNSNEIATYLQNNYLQTEEGGGGGGEDEGSFSKKKLNLNLQRLQISSTYSEMLASALMHSDFENLNSLNLQDNNLSGKAIALLSVSFPTNIRKLDLSQNFFNSIDALALCNIFNYKKYPFLIQFNLSNNQLGDSGLKNIYQPLSVKSKLLIFNMSHNKFTDLSMPLVREILIKNSYLQEIYLSWNRIGSKGGVEIAMGLSNSFVIKVLDLSHNSLGQNPHLRSGVKIIESCTKIESGMLHLDLSYNLFQQAESVHIATALSKNKKLYGFHFEGNESDAIIDSRGFIFFPDQGQMLQKHVATHSLMKREINSVKCIGFNKLQNFNCNVTDNCWICDGWQEIEFAVSDGCSESFWGEPAFLHIDFEDFRPTYMDRDPQNPSRYVLKRMCPPNRRIHFFFTNPCARILFESNDYEKTSFNVNEQNIGIYEEKIFEECASLGAISSIDKGKEGSVSQSVSQTTLLAPNEIQKSSSYIQISKQRTFSVKYMDGTVQEYITPTTVNYVSTRLHQNISKKKGEYEMYIKCLPRQDETFFKINFTNQWHKGISIFRDFVADTPEIELKCFQEDWDNCKIEQILIGKEKSVDLAECKKIIIQKFPLIRILYRYLSCFGILNEVFCVTIHPFSLFASQSKIVDGQLLKMRDMQCLFIAASTKALKAKNVRAPEKALTRNEFLEVMGRIAVDKFIRNKIAKTPAEALDLLLNDKALLNHIKEYEDPQKWRNVRYWTETCDLMMKRYLNFLKTVWNEYADSKKIEKKTTSQAKTMGLTEFLELINEFQLKDENLTEREVVMSFNFALQTVVDEITSDKYMAMSFVEFLEGIARVAEFKSLTPQGERAETYAAGEKLQISLEYKIESLLELMISMFDGIIKERKRRQLLAMKSLQKGSSRIGALKTRKQFIQFSLQEIDEQENNEKNSAAPNKFVSFVHKIMGNLKQKTDQSNGQQTNPDMSKIDSQGNEEIFHKKEHLPDMNQDHKKGGADKK